MTWRIDRRPTEQGIVLHISGRLAEEDLDVVRNALDESSPGDLNDADRLILDVRMPGMTGIDRQARLAERAWRLPIRHWLRR
jgi:FixJ family two-component response regulator